MQSPELSSYHGGGSKESFVELPIDVPKDVEYPSLVALHCRFVDELRDELRKGKFTQIPVLCSTFNLRKQRCLFE